MRTEQLYSLFRNSNGVNTDTRTLSEGQIFFALKGDSFDGNRFASRALDNGASAAIIDDQEFHTGRTILVDDCLEELQALATHYRNDLKVPVLAITGTNGKTTTKELIAALLGKKFKVHYTKGNLNNHIGVPLTILAAPPETQLMIIEMGANHIGEISTLCEIALPDHGIITNIGTAHIEGFGSFEGVVKAKTELYSYLKKVDGIALYNDLNPLLTGRIYSMVNRAVPFSYPDGSELVVTEVKSGFKLDMSVKHKHHTYNIYTNLFGRYNLENVRAAIATGLFFGVEMKENVAAIEAYIPSNNRSQVRNTGRNTLICDAYNANPSSMKAALESFVSLNTGTMAVILGDMLELGEKTDEEHLRILNMVTSINAGQVFLVGNIFSRLAAEKGLTVFTNCADLGNYLQKNPLRGMTILIKGSRGVGLEKVYNLL